MTDETTEMVNQVMGIFDGLPEEQQEFVNEVAVELGALALCRLYLRTGSGDPASTEVFQSSMNEIMSSKDQAATTIIALIRTVITTVATAAAAEEDFEGDDAGLMQDAHDTLLLMSDALMEYLPPAMQEALS